MLVSTDGQRPNYIEHNPVEVQEEVLQVYAGVHVLFECKFVVDRCHGGHRHRADDTQHGRQERALWYLTAAMATRVKLVDCDACTSSHDTTINAVCHCINGRGEHKGSTMTMPSRSNSGPQSQASHQTVAWLHAA